MSLKNLFTKKTIILFLLSVSIMMTSSTFAYWAKYVEGQKDEYTTTITVGSPLYTNHSFVLTSDISTYRYEIDLEYLLENPNINEEDIIFGIIWNDEDLKEKYMNGEVEIEYKLIFEKNGKTANKNRTKLLTSVINVTPHNSNNYNIISNSSPQTFGLNITLFDDYPAYYYTILSRYEMFIEISFEIDD